VQDTWRNLLFRDGRPAAAATNDAVWFLGMAAVVPVAYLQGSDWAVVACWGVGAVCGAVIGFFQTGTRPRPVRASVRWARTDAFGFGKWNAGAALVANIGGNASTFVLSIVLGAEALGGLRSAQTIFAPLTLILPAINLPGLPAVARAWVAGPRVARSLAIRLSGLAIAAVGIYLIGLLLGGWRLLSLLFGEDFAGFRNLIPPIAVGQLLTAGAVGWLLLLKAQLRGRVLLVSRATGAVATLVLVGILASRFGLLGAAWGGTVGAAAQLAITTRAALIPVEPSEEEVPAEDQS
jgi:O-antigen/teichoic acid export membrane protein